MNYFDKILIEKVEFPPIRQEALDFFREEPESIYQFFLHVFVNCETYEDMESEFRNALMEVDWVNHVGQFEVYRFEHALYDIFNVSFYNFFNRFHNFLWSLRFPMEGIEVMTITLKHHDSNCYLIEIIYNENANAIRHEPINPFTKQPMVQKKKPVIYSPYQ